MSVFEPKSMIVSRNGEVRTRTKNRRIRPFLGTIIRDPQHPKRWLATNEAGLPISTHTATRAAAVENLAEYVENTVLEPVSVADHVGVSTEPIDVVTQNDPQAARRFGITVLAVLTGVIGAVPIVLVAYGIQFFS